MKIFVAEIGGKPVAAQGFEDKGEAEREFNEAMLRDVVSSNSVDSSGRFLVREATKGEIECWRDGRRSMISEKRTLDPDMNPMLFFVSGA